MKEQFNVTVEDVTAIDPLKNPANDQEFLVCMSDKVLSTILGMAAGFIAKKLAIGKSVNWFRKIAASVLQFGVASIISRNPGYITKTRRLVYQKLFGKKERNVRKP